MDCQHTEMEVVGNGIYCQVCGHLVEDLTPTTDNIPADTPPDIDDKTEG